MTCSPTPTQCTSCRSGYTLSSGSCNKINCDATCQTCTGGAANNCQTCDASVRTFNSATSTCDLNPPPPTCEANDKAIDMFTDACKDCFLLADYNTNSYYCKISPKTRFLDWTASASLDSSYNIVITITVADPSVVFPTTTADVVPTSISPRWSFTSSAAYTSLSRMN